MRTENPTGQAVLSLDVVLLLKAPDRSALPASRYLMSGAPTTCAACSHAFASKADHAECWHGADGRYYCSTRCASPPRPRGLRPRTGRKAA